jgi:hypothetical protein
MLPLYEKRGRRSGIMTVYGAVYTVVSVKV